MRSEVLLIVSLRFRDAHKSTLAQMAPDAKRRRNSKRSEVSLEHRFHFPPVNVTLVVRGAIAGTLDAIGCPWSINTVNDATHPRSSKIR